jgi:hypothetical protein
MRTNGIESKLLKTFYCESTNPISKVVPTTKDTLFQNILSYLDIQDYYNFKLTCKTITYSINQKTTNTFLKRFHLTGKRREAVFSKYLHLEE